MKKFRLYGNRTGGETPIELANRQIARKIAEEGFVLLKNNGILPLRENKIALYGGGARMTVKGGTGSGDVKERYSVNIEDGLKNNGFEVVGSSWLERFTETRKKEEADFKAMVEEQIKGYPVWKVVDMFKKIFEFKLNYPVGDLIRKEDLSDEAKVCIYVIARQAGEGLDRKDERSDFRLSELEVENLKICKEHYEHLIVILNCGSSLEMSDLDVIDPDAILYYGQAGEEGGNALGEVLAGKVSPSGRLADTWVKRYADHPVSKIDHKEKLEEDYEEGIYVGYRYFDAMKIRPYYPFGYGLSYTSFEKKLKGFEVKGSEVFLDVEVKNTGNHAGKEVVFVFLYKLHDKLNGEVKSLVAFKKSKELSPDESETLKLSFDMKEQGSYDESQDAFLLEAGDYGVSLAEDALHDTMVFALRLKEDRITEKCKRLMEKKRPFKELSIRTEETDLTGLPVCEFDVETKVHTYDYSLPQADEKIQKYLETLSEKELAMFAMGGGYHDPVYIKVMGACGNTTSRLLKKGIPGTVMSDGPAGINIMPKSAYSPSGQTRYVDELPQDYQWGWLKRVIPKLRFLFAGKRDTLCYQYCTAFPNAALMAQTFNAPLIEQAGRGVGEEMLNMGITLWLAPALNIHRDPLCGRNFEYYSEDPLVSGEMAAAMTRGVQSHRGIGVTIKHFACNNRENERTQVSSNLSQRALREIYLRGFKIACKERPMALMSSYNRINGIYTANCRELLIDILRCEWGYEGLVMSDWDAVDNCSYVEAVKSGNNMIMPGTRNTYAALCKAIKEKELNREELQVSAYYALKIVFAAKTSEDFIRENGFDKKRQTELF
ncbi:MAG: glycoside hydrolase family 3 C-terminal domain-containing protein [Erysipelotrichaceae bacterium]|nr:glycoside hydrolase family 3 C-terminal domain-containing protein [Erysipelotrichaceae bacterium]